MQFWIDDKVVALADGQGLKKGERYTIIGANSNPAGIFGSVVTYDLADAEDNVLRSIFNGHILLTKVRS